MGVVVEAIRVAYGEKEILKGIDFEVKDREIVTIVGPNGSGKSTFLKVIARCLKPKSGRIYIDGKDIYSLNIKQVAKKLAFLPQTKNVPSDITVEQLVSYGRYPHLGFIKKLGNRDKKIIKWALRVTGLLPIKSRSVVTLSGGEQQRAWVAMTLAQRPKILLLDEPTTFLDISYQIEILELVKKLNKTIKMSVVMVLHDINQAARYSDKIAVMKNGQIYFSGSPRKVINDILLKGVFNIEADIYEDKVNKCPYFIPRKSKIGCGVTD